MDIFKLGDKILALLEAVFGFWNNQISLVFAMLVKSKFVCKFIFQLCGFTYATFIFKRFD